jgi:hypothetical protein
MGVLGTGTRLRGKNIKKCKNHFCQNQYVQNQGKIQRLSHASQMQLTINISQKYVGNLAFIKILSPGLTFLIVTGDCQVL